MFLIRKRLKLKEQQAFQFDNQRDKTEFYWFEGTELWKYDNKVRGFIKAHVSLNWILDDECKITPVKTRELEL